MKHCLLILGLLSVGITQSQDILAKHEFDAEGVTEIQITGKFCNVSITHGDRVHFLGVIEGKGKKGDFEFNSILSGKTLFIEVSKKFEGPWSKLSKAYMEIAVPDGTRVRVENASGDLYIRDLTSPGFELKSSSGDIKLSRVNGPLNLSSTSGDIRLYGAIGNILLESTSGDQEIQKADGDIRTNATSGNMEFSQVTGDVIAETTSGNIFIKESVGLLNLQTTSGDISGSQVSISKKSNFKASSGDIEIRFRDDLGKYSFNIQSTSGFLRIGDMYGEKDLKSTNSGIEITAITTSGDQYYTN